MNRQFVKGFTLLELIMVMVIVSILATMTTDILTLPVKSYLDQQRRGALVDSMEMSVRQMQRDIRQALPNSIRIPAANTLEFLHTIEGGRYRVSKDIDGSGDILDFTGTEAVASNKSFDVLGSLQSTPADGDFVVIYNLDAVSTGTSTDPNAYDGDNLAEIDGTVSTADKIVLKTAKIFPYASPQQRFFIVDTPVTYRCVDGELRRYDNTTDASYSIGAATATLNYALQAKATSISCSFSYDSGTASRAAMVTLELNLTDQAGESVSRIHQIHVDNLP